MGLLEYTETSRTPLHDHWQARLRLHQAPANRPESAAIPIIVPKLAGWDCPAERALRQEGLSPTVAALDDDRSYGELIARAWEQGGFVLVEDDVVPWPGAVQAMWDCQEPWCVHEYPQGRADLAPALGCVKFSSTLVAQAPGLPERWRGWEWASVDGLLVSAIYEALGLLWHVHQPPVAHARQRTG